jgi:putative tricarboxylic transport membrane protein
MSNALNESGGAGPSHRGVEIGVAVFMAGLALIGIYGSLKVGIGWADEGPQAGFFPFYISVLVFISCAVNLVQTFLKSDDGTLFASWVQLRKVMSVVIPTAIYVLVLTYIGIYLASALLIATFMRWLGRYRWSVVIGTAILVPIITFVIFEKWFLVPLPKGPIERYLGY